MDRDVSRHSIDDCGFPLGAAPRHGRVLRVGRAAHPAHSARPAGAGRRTGRPRCGGRRQLRVPGVRRAIGDADASGTPVDRCDGGRAAAARRGVRRRQPPGASTPCAAWCRSSNSSPSTRRSASRRNWPAHPRPRSKSSARSCGDGCATRPGWSPRSAPARVSRSPRSRPAWPNPMASAWFGVPTSSGCWTVSRSAGCGGSARSPRRNCIGWASTPSGSSPR